jgi:hypothetical protein
MKLHRRLLGSRAGAVSNGWGHAVANEVFLGARGPSSRRDPSGSIVCSCGCGRARREATPTACLLSGSSLHEHTSAPERCHCGHLVSLHDWTGCAVAGCGCQWPWPPVVQWVSVGSCGRSVTYHPVRDRGGPRSVAASDPHELTKPHLDILTGAKAALTTVHFPCPPERPSSLNQRSALTFIQPEQKTSPPTPERFPGVFCSVSGTLSLSSPRVQVNGETSNYSGAR